MRRITRTPVLAIAALAVALGLAGCSSSMGGSESGAAAPAEDRAVTGLEAAEGADGAASAQEPDRSLVITGSITITADDPLAAAEQATAITVAAGGRIDARTQYAPRDGDAGSATLTLRIPAEALEEVRADLGALGQVDETALESVDVGTQVTDLDARITTLRTSIARYTGWLADADTTSDLIELEGAISQRQSELEVLEAQQRELADRVSMSTVTLYLRSEALAPPPEGPGDFAEGLAVGWNGFVAFWAAILVGLGVLLPWLVLFGGIALVVVLIVRRTTRGGTTPPAASDPTPSTMSEA